jgi:CTP synthase (UTP-ammonia lyase)
VAPIRIALIGDFNPEIVAHQGIERSFALAAQGPFPSLERIWLPTPRIDPGGEALADYSGTWCVPGSPYRSMEGALYAIRFAREHRVPFLGTCGGFQHALIDYARNVLGLAAADHAESNPGAKLLFITPLACSLAGATGEIRVLANPLFREAYGAAVGSEPYQCNYGLNPELEHFLHGGPLEVAARDQNGEPRAVALNDHPFFVGTLFQPERRALSGSVHPLVNAFFAACAKSDHS